MADDVQQLAAEARAAILKSVAKLAQNTHNGAELRSLAEAYALASNADPKPTATGSFA